MNEPPKRWWEEADPRAALIQEVARDVLHARLAELTPADFAPEKSAERCADGHIPFVFRSEQGKPDEFALIIHAPSRSPARKPKR